MLRLAEGVGRYIGADFSANALTVGGRTLMTIQPAQDGLASFAGSRLDAALSEAVAARASGWASAGQIVLPITQIGMSRSWALDAVPLVFDELNANLRALDGMGGTYAWAETSPVSLQIGADGLALRGSTALSFVLSPKNRYGSTYAGADWTFNTHFTGMIGGPNVIPVCPPTDLRSFFLVLLDSRSMVVSLAAIGAPGGTVLNCQ